MEGLLKVTPERLSQAANEFLTTGNTISSLTGEMLGIVNSMRSVWQGEAAEHYMTRFSSLKGDIEKINRMIKGHVEDLNDMAREYQSAEKASMEESNRLMSDIVH